MDQILIEGLRIFAYHGVYQEENDKGQNFYIDVVLDTDTRRAGILDDLESSTNYGEVCRFFNTFLTNHTYKLLETAAEKVAEAALLTFPLVRQVTLEIHKPEAPIPLSFTSVSVKIQRGWRRAYLACGSNMGEREEYLDAAVEAFRKDSKCRVLRVSDWVRSSPYGKEDQAEFLNGAIAVETLYTPEELLEQIHVIERENGRKRGVHWGPRTLDLDILLYENCILDTDILKIPHVDMHNRDFVLAPLSQIAPYEIHPLFNKPIMLLYEEARRNKAAYVLG